MKGNQSCFSVRYLLYRNEQYQEELWEISCDLLKDWISSEIWSKYSPSTETTSTAAKQDSGNNDGEDDQPTTTTDSEDKPDDKPPEGEHQTTKDTEHKTSDTTKATVENS